jgi:hypothetical protein
MTLRIPPLWLLVLAGIAMLAYSRSQTRHRMPRVLGDPCVDRFSFNRIKVALPMISIRRLLGCREASGEHGDGWHGVHRAISARSKDAI